ncbi:MAG: signal peptidase I [Prevotellaceae bacterium]|jgi:signal peptidase I|nr:signal peptidase I [Prevotellaceae bacterium]
MEEDKKNKKKWRWLKEVIFWIVFLIVSILLAIAMRIFLLASFVIPSYSMAPTLMPGDFVMVNKAIPGGRIPIKSWSDFWYGRDRTLKRVKGWRAIRRNDVVVFNFPYPYSSDKIETNLDLFYAKRCVAVPGDTFYIDNGIFRVRNCPDTLGYYPHQQAVSQIQSQQDARPGTWNCFPFDTVHYRWNIKNFGPLYIPKINDTLAIDSANVKLYKNLIEYETNLSIKVENGRVILDKDTVTHYIFRKNYYFMTGDHAIDSRDSRYWGLLPEDHITGKAFIIWKSENRDTGKWQWKRFFKAI